MTVSELKRKLTMCSVPDDYEVRADVDYESFMYHIQVDMTIYDIEVDDSSKTVFLHVSD